MKITECYIENFGKISAQGYSFKDGFNCIKEDNGSGKTTLAAFIKVMLYGMSDTKKTSLDENDRRHYLPWGGGACGGSLCFEVGGRSYRIQRSFAPKAADDSFALYDAVTGRACSDFGENLGEELFGIDVDGFERTVFLSERSLTPRSENKTISAKLSDLVGCDGDIGGMDEALKNLENQRRFYQKKGGSGEISDIKIKIAEVNRRIDALNETEGALITAEKRLAQLSYDIAEAHGAEAELAARRERASIKAADNGYEARCKELEILLSERVSERGRWLEFFGGAIPSFEEIDQMAYKSTEAKNLGASVNEAAENRRYGELVEFFGTKVTDSDIEQIKFKLNELDNLRAEEASPAAKRAKELFALRAPRREEIEKAQRAQRRCKSRGGVIGYILCALLCLAGIAGGLLISPVMFSVCALGIFAGIITLAMSLQKIKAKKELSEFFLSVMGSATTDSAEACRLLNEMLLILPDCKELADGARIKALTDEICGFNSLFGIKSDDCARDARKIVEKYAELTAMAAADKYIKENKDKAMQRAALLKQEVDAFLSRFKLSGYEPFSELRRALTEYNSVSADISSKESELADIRGKRALGEDGVKEAKEELLQIDRQRADLHERLTALNREYTLTERLCNGYTDELEGRDELVMQLGELEERLAQNLENYETVLMTKKYLQTACDNMTARYIGKTKESFEKYARLIGGENGRFEMDTDFGVSKIEGASTKPVDAYSRGTKDLYNLASRLALVDSLYDKEEPFIIMDDPFTALDDTKTKAALDMLKNIAKERQIIYFTCSESRAAI